MNTPEALEKEIQFRIDEWLAHMRWRSDYAEWRDRRLWQENHQGLHVRSLADHAGDLRGAQVLDLGSGMGGFAVALARDLGARVIACDFNPAYGRITRLRGRRYDLDVPALTGVGEHIPFPEGQFDIVTAWDVLEHVRDPLRFVAECARVCKPGGLFFFTATNRFAWRDPHYHLHGINYLPRPLAEKIIARAGRRKQGPHQDAQRLSAMHYMTMNQVLRLVRQNGFTRLVDLRAERAQRAARTKPNSAAARLDRLRLLSAGYWVYRTAIAGTYELMAQK